MHSYCENVMLTVEKAFFAECNDGAMGRLGQQARRLC